MDIDQERLLSELKAIKKHNFDPELELRNILATVQKPSISQILKDIKYSRFVNAGGSGLVFEVVDTVSESPRALKLSRTSAAKEASEGNGIIDVALEIKALAMVSHQNITRFYGGAKEDDGSYAILTELVEGGLQRAPMSIDEWLTSSIKLEKEDKQRHAFNIDPVLTHLASLLHGYAAALSYMHDRLQLYHMDVKPGNLLVDNRGNAYVTDLGFARLKRNYAEDEKFKVGFTFGYNHPRLNENLLRLPESFAKASNVISGKELDPRFDMYAFGKTMLRLLFLLKDRFGDRVYGSYHFNYLHLLATLLLDGRPQDFESEHNGFAKEVALGITLDLQKTFHFSSFVQVQDRLDRLLGSKSIDFIIPELDRWYPRQLNHGVGNLNVTPRIQRVIDHPAFRRLRTVQHLGLDDEVYSGATHTRYSHTLGVTSRLCDCLHALYRDPENPIFRVLVEYKDFNTVILAGLLHDLGQSSFGHELEELSERCYSHKKVGAFLLKRADFLDKDGRSLLDLIKGDEADQWAVSVDEVLLIMDKPDPKAKKETNIAQPRIAAFRELLDGPIDADKLDYLARDSRATGVPYGNGIDYERMLRCITVLPMLNKERKTHTLNLGVKEKGLVSSEGVAFARRQMYQAVYLQHTARMLKAATLTVCRAAHERLLDAAGLASKDVDWLLHPELKELSNVVNALFACHLADIAPPNWPFAAAVTKKLNALHKKIRKGAIQAMIAGLSLPREISFFYVFMTADERAFLDEAQHRTVYKRLWERSFSSLTQSQLDGLRQRFASDRLESALREIEKTLIEKAMAAVSRTEAEAESMNVIPGEVLELQCLHKFLIVDFPARHYGPGGNPPPIVRDIDRKDGNFAFAEKVGHLWNTGMAVMMNEITSVRIFCEGAAYDLLHGALKKDVIVSSVWEGLDLAD